MDGGASMHLRNLDEGASMHDKKVTSVLFFRMTVVHLLSSTSVERRREHHRKRKRTEFERYLAETMIKFH